MNLTEQELEVPRRGLHLLIAIAMINALPGALIGLPLVIAGRVQVGQASRLLSSKDSKQRIPNLNAGYESKSNRLSPATVTEQTTLNLNNHRQVEIASKRDAD